METKLDTLHTLQFACGAVAVLRALEISDATMAYSDLGKAIGLVEGAWEPAHRQQVADVLDLVSAVDKQTEVLPPSIALTLRRSYTMEKPNEIDLTADRQEMRTGRAIFLLIAMLLLWCGSMLLSLDLANVSGNHWQVALIGSLMAASAAVGYGLIFLESPLGSPANVGNGLCRPGDTTGFHAQGPPQRGAFVDQENSQAGMQKTSRRGWCLAKLGWRRPRPRG